MELESAVTSLGALFPAACVAASAALWCWFSLNRLVATCLLVCFGGAVGASIGLKLIAGATAPPLSGAGLFQFTQGAPSGHAVAATMAFGCAAVLFARLWRTTWSGVGLAGCALAILAVCVTRVTLHTHSIADVAAGLLVGLGFLWLFDRAVQVQHRPPTGSAAGLLGVVAGAALLALASGLRISSTHFL